MSAISSSASAKSASVENSCPTISSASPWFGATQSGPAANAWRSGSPSESTISSTSRRRRSRTVCAYQSGSTRRGSEPASTIALALADR